VSNLQNSFNSRDKEGKGVLSNSPKASRAKIMRVHRANRIIGSFWYNNVKNMLRE